MCSSVTVNFLYGLISEFHHFFPWAFERYVVAILTVAISDSFPFWFLWKICTVWIQRYGFPPVTWWVQSQRLSWTLMHSRTVSLSCRSVKALNSSWPACELRSYTWRAGAYYRECKQLVTLSPMKWVRVFRRVHAPAHSRAYERRLLNFFVVILVSLSTPLFVQEYPRLFLLI